MKYLFIVFVVIAASTCSPKLSPDAGWSHQEWVVVEMKGVPVQQSGGRRDAHITFDPTEKDFQEMEVVTRLMETIAKIKMR